MTRPRRRGATDAPGAIDLLEEAAYLLRRLPIATHAAYFVGTVPFVLGLLYFVADMSRGTYAVQHVSESALGMTMLFAWMKAWHAVSAGRALALLEQREPERLGIWKFFLLAVRQFRFHAFGLALLPLSFFALALPFGWTYAYFQSATVLVRSTEGNLHTASLGQAKLWPKQNFVMLALVALFTLFVFLNVGVALFKVPDLLRSLLGIEGFNANAGWNPLNTTFLTVATGLTFLAVDPLIKCAYVLRCFYGQAQSTGVDLLVRVRESLPRVTSGVAVIALMFVALAVTTSGRAAEAVEEESATSPSSAATPVASTVEPRAVDSNELNNSLDRVLERSEFSWRSPRPTIDDDQGEPGVIARFFESMSDSIRNAARWVGRAIEKIFDWIFDRGKNSGDYRPGNFGALTGLAGVLRPLLIILGVILVGALLWLAWRWWAGSREKETPTAEPVVTPLIERDDVTADQLPEDEWIRLARELLARGDVRLALRALFLGSLAALGARGVLVLARHKSNRDYERELSRRGTQLAGISSVFSENRRFFERAWYGRESIGADDVKRFEESVRHIRGGGA